MVGQGRLQPDELFFWLSRFLLCMGAVLRRNQLLGTLTEKALWRQLPQVVLLSAFRNCPWFELSSVPGRLSSVPRCPAQSRCPHFLLFVLIKVVQWYEEHVVDLALEERALTTGIECHVPSYTSAPAFLSLLHLIRSKRPLTNHPSWSEPSASGYCAWCLRSTTPNPNLHRKAEAS